ncbi:hypothetical protein [Pseudactinotalea sp. Z1748]|uniref:hypothetical protein n=1 Tax=Pseudactinotalea sp. Z1748 TaxID=3413027 RepID=UPI003C7D43C8
MTNPYPQQHDGGQWTGGPEQNPPAQPDATPPGYGHPGTRGGDGDAAQSPPPGAHSAHGQPAYGQSPHSQPGIHPAYGQPGYAQPGTQPAPPQYPYGQPGYAQPGTQPAPPQYPYGQPGYAQPGTQPAPPQYPYAPPGHQGMHTTADHPQGPPPRRPITVLLGSILVWLACAASLVTGIGVLVVRGRAADLLVSLPFMIPEFHTGFSILISLIGAFAIAMGLVFGALTVGAFRGSNGARWVLVILIGLAALSALPAVVEVPTVESALAVLIPALVVVLFLVPPAPQWYRYRSHEAARARRTIR